MHCPYEFWDYYFTFTSCIHCIDFFLSFSCWKYAILYYANGKKKLDTWGNAFSTNECCYILCCANHCNISAGF